MSGGEIKRLHGPGSVVIQYVLKPALIAGGVLIYPWLHLISTPRQMAVQQVIEATSEASMEMWPPPDVRPHFGVWLFASLFAAFLEADNAYLQFFLKFVEKYAKKRRFKP
jgi:hypothetical protein